MITAAAQADALSEALDDGQPEPAGFARLRLLLKGAGDLQDELDQKKFARVVRRALHAQSFERAVLDPLVPAVVRLRRLAELQRLVRDSTMRRRDRDEAMVDLDRNGMRVMWGLRIVETVLESGAPPENRAAALLSLLARGVLPAGACAKSALEPAKRLLMTKEATTALSKSPHLRIQILDLLEAAEHKPPPRDDEQE
ncbi:MAG: hypothetical protein AB7M12_00235 [Hyphomonadaceae bacterium]